MAIRESEPLAAVAAEPARTLDHYRIFVLGGPGSGKTVFLASMFRRLNVQREKVGFYLAADADQRNTLIKKYLQLANPGQSWPAATRRADVSEWNFTCAIKSAGQVHDVFRLSYLDYAGEFIYDTGGHDSDNRVRLLSEAEQADSVLVLLDGEKILRHMGSPAPVQGGGTDLATDLAFLLPAVNGLGGKPVHFVLTKWDLLEGSVSLRAIRNALLEMDDFRDVVSTRLSEGCPTRLIPVSALGSNFVRLGDDGRMYKVADQQPRPMNVEMSIACTLIDHFEVSRQRLLGAYERHAQRELSGFDRWQTRIIRKGARALEFFDSVRLPPEWGLGIAALSAVVNAVNDRLDKDLASIEKKLQEKYGRIKDRAGAVEAVILANQRLTAVLGDQFPESDFGHV